MTENLYTKDCIRTFTGLYVNVFEPHPDMFCIEDIAHALSNQPRFGGHLPHFYSVAQHSINCADIIPEHKFTALMHDAAEAYIIDLPKPIKLRIPQYNEIENGLMEIISKKFGFQYPFCEEIHIVDKTMLEIEWNGLMLKKNPRLTSWDPETAEKLFLESFDVHSKK